MSLISSGSGFHLTCTECSHCAFGNGYHVGKISPRVSISSSHLYGFRCVVANSTYSKIKDAYLIFELSSKQRIN